MLPQLAVKWRAMLLPWLAPLRTPGRYSADERHQRQAVRGRLGRAIAKVAVRYRISANYLALVCDYLNVPYPHRGYWARRQFGKAPTRLPLPAPRPGNVIEWERGDAVPRPTPAVAPPAGSGTSGRPTSRSERPARHQLLAGIRESFEKARFSEAGCLRPFKRNLVDIFVTKEALAYALDTANDLFLRLEARGHRVVLATDSHFGRPERHVFEGRKCDYYNREPWRPGRETVVPIGAVALLPVRQI